MNNKYLEDIQKSLQSLGFDTHLLQVNENVMKYQLGIIVDQELDLQLSVFFLGDMLEVISSEENDSEISKEFSEQKVDFLQLYIKYPIDFKSSTISDLARLILMANWSTPIGAFGLNESQKTIYYRHVFECMENEPGENLVIEAINAMAYYAGLRYESLSLIASGEMSLDEYLNKLEQEDLRAEEFPGYDL